MTIGNLSDAARILFDKEFGNDTYLLTCEGTTRMVYLMDNVIYKVQYDSRSGDNRLEYDNVIANRDNLPTGVFYPEVSLYTIDGVDIIAMSYIEGDAVGYCYCEQFNEPHTNLCMPKEVYDIVNNFLVDVSGANVIVNNNGIFIIDAVV